MNTSNTEIISRLQSIKAEINKIEEILMGGMKEAENEHEKLFHPPKEAAEKLGIPYNCLRQLYLYEDGFPVIKIGSRYYISVPAAKKWIEENS
ncbi:hypothetical protein ACIZ62_13025 [Acetobacterium carbinolicum]|uniref:hypothetical protein n=1 Tax=Acetobacterium carbinolicum TaxID=52690 RepID=UPI0039BF9B3F